MNTALARREFAMAQLEGILRDIEEGKETTWKKVVITAHLARQYFPLPSFSDPIDAFLDGHPTAHGITSAAIQMGRVHESIRKQEFLVSALKAISSWMDYQAQKLSGIDDLSALTKASKHADKCIENVILYSEENQSLETTHMWVVEAIQLAEA